MNPGAKTAGSAYGRDVSVWPVFIDSWQQQSGGRPFAVGDEVEWTVVLVDGREHGWPDELLVDARVELQQHPERLPRPGSIAVSGGVQAWWEGSEPAGTVLELRGALVEDHHSLGLVYSRGTVRRIQVVTQCYEPSPNGALMATWDGWQARDVDFSPPLFRRDVQLLPERRDGWHAGIVESAETGLLVSLEADEPDPLLSPPVLQVRTVDRPTSSNPR